MRQKRETWRGATVTRLIGGASWSLVAVVICISVFAASASAGPAPGLCKMNLSRGEIPKNFAIDACFDGQSLWLRNNLGVPIHLRTFGSIGSRTKVSIDLGLAASVTRKRFNDPLLLLPHDLLKIGIGSRPAKVILDNTDAGGFYALATTAATFMPGGVAKAAFDAFTTLIAEIDDDFAKYADCRQNHSNLVCKPILVRDLSFAIGRATVTGLAKGTLNTLLSTYTFLKWADSQPAAILTILGSDRAVSLGPSNPLHTMSFDLSNGALKLDGQTFGWLSSGLGMFPVDPRTKYGRPDYCDLTQAGSSDPLAANASRWQVEWADDPSDTALTMWLRGGNQCAGNYLISGVLLGSLQRGGFLQTNLGSLFFGTRATAPPTALRAVLTRNPTSREYYGQRCVSVAASGGRANFTLAVENGLLSWAEVDGGC